MTESGYMFIGVFPLAFGVGMLALYAALFSGAEFPKKLLGKLEPMQKKFGTIPGLAIHVSAYAVFPILFGILILTGKGPF